MSGLLETAGQLAQAGPGLTFQALLLVTIALEGQPHLWKEVRGKGEDTGFALGTEGEGGRAMGLSASAAAGVFAATAMQDNEAASGWVGWLGSKQKE